MVDFKGQVSACCQFEASSTLEQYDDMMKEHRQAMEQGIQMKPCRRCWEDESNGFASLRQSAITDFARRDPPTGIQILDIRVTNNCNLACTMCSEHASSLWGKLKGIDSATTLSMDIQDKLIELSDNLVKLSIQGGEPFYGDEFISFVNRLPNKSNIELEIFSNIITADIETIKRWTIEFKHVMIIASVDGVEEVFETIRWPASWSKLERKFKALYELPKIGLSFNFTLQNNNILNLKRFIDWRNNNFASCPITISILEQPAQYHFTVLTEEEKQQALTLLDKINAMPDELETIKTVKEHLLTRETNLLEQRYQSLEAINKMRNLVRPEGLEPPHG